MDNAGRKIDAIFQYSNIPLLQDSKIEMLKSFADLSSIALFFIMSSKIYTVRQANIIRASRHKPLVYSVMTQVALLGDAFCFIISNGVVRAGIDAGPAPGTQIVIQDDQAVLPFTDGRFRTGLNTRGGVAVSAKVDAKYKFSLIIAPPRSVFSYRNQTDPLSRPIFLLAGHLTGSAAPTKVMIYT